MKYKVGDLVWSCDQFAVDGPFTITKAYMDDCGGYCKPAHPCYHIDADKWCHGEHTLFASKQEALDDLQKWRDFRDWAHKELKFRERNKGR